MSRSTTRSFTAGASASAGAAPRAEPLEPRPEPVDVLAQRIDAPQELLALIARYEVGALMGEVLGEVLERGAGRLAGPGGAGARHACQLMREHIAAEERQLFLEVRPQQPRQLAKLLGDLRVAADRDIAALQVRLRAGAAKGEEPEWAAAYGGVRCELIEPEGERDPGRCHPQPRHVADHEGDALAAQLRAQLPRAHRARQAAVHEVLERRGQHGAAARSGAVAAVHRDDPTGEEVGAAGLQ